MSLIMVEFNELMHSFMKLLKEQLHRVKGIAVVWALNNMLFSRVRIMYDQPMGSYTPSSV